MTENNTHAMFLQDIVKKIVSNPDKVEVDQEVDKQGVKLTLRVDKADVGKVIGSHGKMATAIRTIMHAYGGHNEARISVIIEEPEERS